MAYGLTFFRDSIVVNKTFQNNINTLLQAKNVPPGSTLLFATRSFSFDPAAGNFAFTLPGYNLIILADSIDTQSGHIDVSGQPGSVGQTGLPGAPGHVMGNGGQGGRGGDGTAGGNGSSLTILCKQLVNLQINANGGAGGQGGTGGVGGHGGPGVPPKPPLTEGEPGGDGGDGGPGGNGGTGGTAGQVTISFVTDNVAGGFQPAKSISAVGGNGGASGAGGHGGGGGYAAAKGSDGPAGNPGSKGNDVQPAITHVDEPTFWSHLLVSIDQAAIVAWSQYRLSVGVYYFRAFNPSGPPNSGYLTLALGEFDAVLQLQPQEPNATNYRNWLLDNQNVLGLARDIDILPDFPTYISVDTNYGNLILSVFQSASNMLLENVTLDQKKQDLQDKISSMNDLLTELNLELSKAQDVLQEAQADQKFANQQVSYVTQQIQAQQQKIQDEQTSFLTQLGPVITTVGAVAGAITALVSGGASLVPMVTAIISLGQELSPDTLTNLAANPQAQKDFKEAGGDLKNLLSGIQGAYNVYKVINQLSTAQSPQNDPLVQQLNKLMAEDVQLLHQQLLANMHVTQAQLGVQAVNAQITRVNNDIQRAQNQLTTLTGETNDLEQAAFTLIRLAQNRMDVLIKYAFLAARALEIYTLADLSNGIHYDYGYIHPDVEQDYLVSFLPLTQLISQYQESWSQFVNIVGYSDIYESYFTSGNVVHDIQKRSFSDPATLSHFQQQHDLLFTVNLQDLPADRYEAKVESVSLALLGAKASATIISCVVEHSGVYDEMKIGSTVVQQILGPRPAIIQAQEVQLQYSGEVSGTNPQDLSFWGRGVAATWHLYIEPDVVSQNNVDLIGLTEIQINIGYQAFFQ